MSDPIETFVAGGVQAMKDAVAGLPFRSAPEFSDVYAAGEALLRYVATTPSPVADVEPSPADEPANEPETPVAADPVPEVAADPIPAVDPAPETLDDTGADPGAVPTA